MVDDEADRRFRDFVALRLGLHSEHGARDRVSETLRKRVAATRSASAEAYVTELFAAAEPRDELRLIADDLTINETFFFRNSDNFRALMAHVERPTTAAPRRALRVLSAGCSTGEEPYSIAITLRETLPAIDTWDIRIVGVDLSVTALARARAGRYSSWALRATPDAVRRRWFERAGTEFQLDRSIREMVSFEEQNLSDPRSPIWAPNQFDVVFCRNVVMYFTPDVMRSVVDRIENALRPGGLLFLGHAETLRGVTDQYRLCHSHDTFYYQTREHDVDSPGGTATLPVRPVSAVYPTLPARESAPQSTAWMGEIQRASDRIAALGSTPIRPCPPARAEAKPPNDLSRVVDAIRRERFSEALSLLAELPDSRRADPEALLLQAVVLTHCGSRELAESTCARLLEIDAADARAHYVLALCREDADDPEGALRHDCAAVGFDPEFAMPRLHMGLLARRRGDDETARRELAGALSALGKEQSAHVLLFGGGFSREALVDLCRSELRAAGGAQ